MICVLALVGAAGVAAGEARERWARLPGAGEGAVELRADTLTGRQGGGGLRAEGGVLLRWGSYELRADHATFDPDTGVAEAEGDVRLRDGDGNLLECRRLEIDTATERGTVEDASLWIAAEGYRVWGARLTKTGPRTYRADDAGFTACDGTWPAWRVAADRLEVELDGYLVGHGAALWVEGVPVLYTPYLLLPVKTERQSGFLFPRLGFTSTDGLYGTLRYYWAVSDSADATLELTWRSRRGWEEAAEFRYALARGHEGRVGGSFLDDRLTGRRRYTLEADHLSRFAGPDRARLHLDYVGDDEVQRDLGQSLDERGTSRTRSFAVGTWDLGAGSLFGLGSYLQTLDGDQGAVLQTLPQLGVLGRETPLVGPLVWSPTVRASRFRRGDGPQGERLELAPGLGAGAALGPVGVAARGRYRQHLYRTDGSWTARGAADARVDAELSLARRFGELVHLAEPRVGLRWQEAGRGDAAPAYDAADRFEHGAVATLSLDNRVLAGGALRDLAALDLDAAYDLADSRWRPLRGEAGWRPADGVTLAADAEYDPRGRSWRRWAARGELRDRRGDRAVAEYRYVEGEAGYLDGGLEVPVGRVLQLEYRNRYSARDRRVLEESYGVRLDHPCWIVALVYSRNWQEDADAYEHRYLVQLELAGLGRGTAARGVLP